MWIAPCGAKDCSLPGTFSNSRLVRLLGQGVPADFEASGMDVAERLSLWLNAFDAIGLQGTHQAIRAMATAATGKPAAIRTVPNLAEDFQRVRSVLADLVAREPLAAATDESAGAADGGFARYQQRHLHLQRQMEQMIAALRDHVRQALSRASPALRQLATLDAAFEQMLATREQALLATVPARLQRRFAQLREADGGLQTFHQGWGAALLAELDLRLEPVAGLIDALNNASRNRR